MSALERAALLVALAAPVLALVAMVLERSPLDDHRTVQAGAAVSAAAWVVLLVAGARGRVPLLHLSPLGAAGGCGAGLLAAAVLDRGQRRRRVLTGAGIALSVVGLGLVGGHRGVQVVVLTAGLAVAAMLAVDATPPEDRAPPALLALLGTVAALVGAGALLVGDERWDLPEMGSVSRPALVALVVAGAAWAVAGTVRCRRPTALVLPGGLVLGLAAGPLHRGNDDLALLALFLGVAALAVAAGGRGAMALALLALAAACASPGLAPASRLLAVAAVLVTAAADRPLALVAAVPGGVALAGGVVDDGGWLAATMGAAAVGVAALLTRRGVAATRDAAAEAAPAPVGPGLVPAAAVGTWLLAVPGSWTWTGAELGHYDRGVARGLLAAAVVVAAVLVPRLAPGPAARPVGRRRAWPANRRLRASARHRAR